MKFSSWRFLDTNKRDAAWNMAIDESLLSNYREGDPPIFRLYEWESSLSFGRSQNVASSLDIDRLTIDQVPFVRRMSGGGILAHGHDISYAIIIPRSEVNSLGIKKSYKHLSQFLIEFYSMLGLKPMYAAQTQIKNKKSEICLTGREEYDIVVENKKIGGNAQRYQKNALLQHGSIPLSLEGASFEALFKKDRVISQATSLQKLGVTLSAKEIKTLLREAFLKHFQSDFLETQLTQSEYKSAANLNKIKYSNQQWNLYGKYDTA